MSFKEGDRVTITSGLYKGKEGEVRHAIFMPPSFLVHVPEANSTYYYQEDEITLIP